MNFYINQIFDNDYPFNAARYCDANSCRIVEIEPENGKRRFQIQTIPSPTPEEIAEQARLEAERKAEEARVPDLEDATVDLAAYVAELEARIAVLETNHG